MEANLRKAFRIWSVFPANNLGLAEDTHSVKVHQKKYEQYAVLPPQYLHKLKGPRFKSPSSFSRTKP